MNGLGGGSRSETKIKGKKLKVRLLIGLTKGGRKLSVDYKELDDPLPFKIIYTNYTDFRSRVMLVYMIFKW